MAGPTSFYQRLNSWLFQPLLARQSHSPQGQKPSPDDYVRKRRIRYTGLTASSIGTLLCLIAAGFDSAWGETRIAYADLLFATGCIVSILWTLAGPQDESEFAWLPVYSALCIDALLHSWYTGGIESPFLGLFLTLIFFTGLVVDKRFSIKAHLGFCGAIFAFFLFAEYRTGWIQRADLPSPLSWIKTSILILGNFTCISVLLKSEARLTNEMIAQNKRLVETQSQLEHTARLAEIGNLIATTAHEMAQPVQVITNASSLLQRLSKLGNTNPELFESMSGKIYDSSFRLSRLLRQLRDFSRKDEFKLAPLDLRESVMSVKVLVEHDLRTRNIDFQVHLSEDPVMILGDNIQLQQVLLNLINNAKDAVNGMEQASIRLIAETSSRWSRIKVVNGGPGIPLEIQSKLFNPYFTTKEKGKGTGLGLTICANLIEKHFGRIFFASQPGETVFVIELPVAQASKEDASRGLMTSLPLVNAEADRKNS